MKTAVRLIVLFALLLIALPLQAAHYRGPGLVEAQLVTRDLKNVGVAKVWNTAQQFVVHVMPEKSWEVRNIQMHIAPENADRINKIPATRRGYLIPGRFEYQDVFMPDELGHYTKFLDLAEELDFAWGEPYEELRVQNIAIHVSVVRVDDAGQVVEGSAAWAYTGLGASVNEDGTFDDDLELENMGRGWWFSYELGHPKRGHFVDSPVEGLDFSTPTNSGKTDAGGAFDFFPGETVELAIGGFPIGSTLADHRISPLDLYEGKDLDDPEIGNLARLLQSLDIDGDAQGGIVLTPEVVGLFETAMGNLAQSYLDFSDDAQISSIINEAIDLAAEAGITLYDIDAADAIVHLDTTISGSMFRKNASKTPNQGSSKAKLEVMPVWIPAQKANGEAVTLEYSDEDGNPIPDLQLGDPVKAKPLVTSYTDEDPATGAHDVYLAISRDDGNSWKRKNLSRMADRSSFTLPDGTQVYGHSKKPVIKVKGNYILVMWSSKFARGGKPRYAIKTDDEYLSDDPYAVDDVWGVQGPQRSVDYAEEGFPEVGVVPYSAVWACRIVIDKTTGDITYYKPERLTSGRRDANQIFLAGAGGAGFAAVWQEDPEGLRPGDASGPGPGWGGATTSHKTDIWYSSISWANFAKIDTNYVIGGDPEHSFGDDFEGRPKALVPMSLPMRVTDNDALNTDNLMVELGTDGLPVEDADGNWIPIVNTDATSYDEQDPNEDGSGSHRYGYLVDGMCEDFHQFVNNQGVTKRACITADGRLLDGDTGASRPNIFLQPYYKKDADGVTVKSAYAIIVYEETKGVGSGATDHLPDEGPYGDEASPDEGKNVHYHSFDFNQPGLVSAGNILNHPETDESGNIVYIVDDIGNPILDFKGNKIPAYENARRPRLVMQSKSAAAASTSKTILAALYKEGAEGKGRPSDIMMRRMVMSSTGNPYAFDNFICEENRVTDCGKTVCVKGAKNMSSATPTQIWLNPESEPDSNGDPTKVTRWQYSRDNLEDKSGTNPYDDARAHRGALRGDFLVVGYTWTPNWAASRNGHDKYDFYIRRSFDGGGNWTTDPNGDGVVHTDTYKIYSEFETEDDDDGRDTETVITEFAKGAFEKPLNISKLKNNKETVAEPRIVATPGTIWKKGPGKTPDGTDIVPIPTGYPEDVQDPAVFWIAYGTAENPPKSEGGDIIAGVHERAGAPLDLFYSFSTDRGENFHLDTWEVNPDSDGNNAGDIVTRMPRLAKGDSEQGECQLRMTPDGSRFYATWLQEGLEGSDIWMRRMMPKKFTRNNGADSGQ